MPQSPDNHLIGEILQQAHLISPAQLDIALRDQKKYQEMELGYLKLGEILELRGWLKQETTDFFVQKWSTLLTQHQRFPLGYYLRQAALLTEQQINYLIEEQQTLSMRLRLGELAYLEGWVNPKTVNYFVQNLSHLPGSSQPIPQLIAYKQQILQQYQKGKTNFQSLKLDKICLQNIHLRGVNLNYSELEQASLQGINLNHSSLRGVNLAEANLKQASLRKTNLQEANLAEANLQQAYLQEANLKNANLRGANLKQANLIKVSLEGADLREAKMWGAICYGAYYDKNTLFDRDFNPALAGMALIQTELGYPRIFIP